jgi:hypothetical protein
MFSRSATHFWKIEGYNSLAPIFTRVFPLGYLTSDQMIRLLQRLAAKLWNTMKSSTHLSAGTPKTTHQFSNPPSILARALAAMPYRLAKTHTS